MLSHMFSSPANILIGFVKQMKSAKGSYYFRILTMNTGNMILDEASEIDKQDSDPISRMITFQPNADAPYDVRAMLDDKASIDNKDKDPGRFTRRSSHRVMQRACAQRPRVRRTRSCTMRTWSTRQWLARRIKRRRVDSR